MTLGLPSEDPGARGPTLPFQQQRVLELVSRSPGICLQEIANTLGLSRTAAVHHVRRLERGHLLTKSRSGRRVAHFSAATPTEAPGQASLSRFFSLLRLRTVRLVLDEIRQDPTISWNEIARRLQMSAHSIRWHISRLTREGVLEVRPGTRARDHRVELRPDVQNLLSAAPTPPPEAPQAIDGQAPPEWMRGA